MNERNKNIKSQKGLVKIYTICNCLKSYGSDGDQGQVFFWGKKQWKEPFCHHRARRNKIYLSRCCQPSHSPPFPQLPTPSCRSRQECRTEVRALEVLPLFPPAGPSHPIVHTFPTAGTDSYHQGTAQGGRRQREQNDLRQKNTFILGNVLGRSLLFVPVSPSLLTPPLP